MPIGAGLANNLKVNNMVGPTNVTTITVPDRDMSLDDDRGTRRQNINTANNSNNKAEIIASRIANQSKSPDRYIIGNNLVVNLNAPAEMNQTVYNIQSKPVKSNPQSIFPSTTTATTANSLTEKQQQLSEAQQKRLSGLEPLGPPPQTMHQRFRSLNYPNTNPISPTAQQANNLKLNLPLKYLKNNIPVIANGKKQNFSNTKTNWNQGGGQFENLNKTAIINFQAIQGGSGR